MLARKHDQLLVAFKSSGAPPIIVKMGAGDLPLARVVGAQVRRYRLKSGLSLDDFMLRVLAEIGADMPRFNAANCALDLETPGEYLAAIESGDIVPGADVLVAAAIVAGLPIDMFDELQNRMSRLERLVRGQGGRMVAALSLGLALPIVLDTLLVLPFGLDNLLVPW